MIELRKMQYLVLLFVTSAVAQMNKIDPAYLAEVFGITTTTEDPSRRSTTQRLEDITIKPTEGTSMYVDRNGENCQCVPYYLCDKNHVAVDINNATVTGWGLLDVRFGDGNDRKCQESVEVCCTLPKDPSTVPKPKPDPTKIKGCGYTNPHGLGVTITGSGNEAQIGEFPWVVAIMDKAGKYGGVGVLIHPQVVMTGAHIANKYEPGTMKIRAGEWDTQTVKENLEHQERDVEQVYSHKDYQSESLKNDVALLRLASPVDLAEHINIICMPEQDEVFDSHKNCVANGWGKDVFGLQGRYAVILKKVEVDMVPHENCNMQLKRTRLGTNFVLHSSFVCAGGEPGKDTCQGDGGAPLACPIGNNRYKLTGLVAWGVGCGGNVPAVYVNVPAFKNWVDDKMAEWGFETTSYRNSE